MQGYKINSLSTKTQEFIEKEGLDTNKDGLINDDNGELSNLLSKTGKKDINELCYDNWFDAKKEDFCVGGMFAFAGAHYWSSGKRLRPKVKISDLKNDAKKLFTSYNGVKPKPMSLDIPYNPPKTTIPFPETEMYKWFKERGANKEAQELLDEFNRIDAKAVKDYDKRYNRTIEKIKEHNKKCAEWKPKVSMKECLKEALTKNKKTALLLKTPISALLFGLSSMGIGIAAYLFSCDPSKGIAQWFKSNDYSADHTERSEYEDQFRQVFGEEADLKEYTPQKGEYWTSILKAKYGVDEGTAQRMAHRIKDVIYEDSLAAKQTPIMYLPDTWTFEGKTYTYNDSVKAERTENYSDDVKTEMGNMNKDIKY